MGSLDFGMVIHLQTPYSVELNFTRKLQLLLQVKLFRENPPFSGLKPPEVHFCGVNGQLVIPFATTLAKSARSGNKWPLGEHNQRKSCRGRKMLCCIITEYNQREGVVGRASSLLSW